MSERDWLSRFLHEEVEPQLRAEDVYGELAHKRGPCPLHSGSDNATAFRVWPGSTRWTCHTRCGHGDAARYLMEKHGLTFLEAVRRLAVLVGEPFPAREVSPEEQDRHEKRSRRSRLFETFLAQARLALLADTEEAKRARAYLVGKRGFPEDALGGLDLGLYTTRDDVKRCLLEADIPEADVDASGVRHDRRWEGRLVGAWRDVRGAVGTFWARDMTGTAEKEHKYLRLTVEHGWGRKEDELIAAGLDVALRPDAGGKGNLVVVEGFLDVPSLRVRGFANVVALGARGDRLNPKRWEALHALGVREVTLALDADKTAPPGERPAGLKGTIAALDAHQKADKGHKAPVCYVVPPEALDGAKDPDELVRERGLDAFRAALDAKVPGRVFRGLTLLEGITPSSGEAERRRAVEDVARFLGDGLGGAYGKRDEEVLVQAAAERTGWSPEALAGVFEEAARKAQAETEKALLDAAIREAQDGVRAGTSLDEVRRKLEAGLVASQPFSADGALRESWRTVEEWGGGEDWLSDNPPPRRYLLTRPNKDGKKRGAVPLGRVGMLAAAGGSGKSWALCQLALSIATGREWLGTYTVPSPGRVLLALAEEEAEEMRRRLFYGAQDLGLSKDEQRLAKERIVGLPLAGHGVALTYSAEELRAMPEGQRPPPGVLLETPFAHALRERLSADEWRLIVLDPMSRFAGPDVETDNAQATRFVQTLESFTHVSGNPTVMVAHHTTKASRADAMTGASAIAARGSSGLTDAVRWQGNLIPAQHSPPPGFLWFEVTKGNYTEQQEPLLLARGDLGVLRIPTDDERKDYDKAEAEAGDSGSSSRGSRRKKKPAPEAAS